MSVVTVHLKNGEITAVQILDYKDALTTNFPQFIQERIAILKIAEPKTFVVGVMGTKINSEYAILTITPSETKKINKLLGEQNGTNAGKESKTKSS